PAGEWRNEECSWCDLLPSGAASAASLSRAAVAAPLTHAALTHAAALAATLTNAAAAFAARASASARSAVDRRIARPVARRKHDAVTVAQSGGARRDDTVAFAQPVDDFNLGVLFDAD